MQGEEDPLRKTIPS